MNATDKRFLKDALIFIIGLVLGWYVPDVIRTLMEHAR